MKRTEVKLAGILLTLVFTFTGCQKEIVTTNLILDKTHNATVKVYFFAELDKTKLGLEFAPNGTKVFISIPNSTFNPNSTGNYIDSAFVNNGIVVLSVPTVSTGATVTIKGSEFISDQVQSFGSVSAKIPKIFTVTAPQTISVTPGESKTKEITYDGENVLDNFAETVTCSFILRADLDATIAGDEIVPQGTIIDLFTTTWAGTATVAGIDGKINATIPKGAIISAKFEATKKLTVLPYKKFLYSATIGSQNVNTTYAQTITFTGIQNEN